MNAFRQKDEPTVTRGAIWSAAGVLLIAVFAVEVAVMLIGSPKCLDDWWYMIHLRDWFEAQGVDNPEYGGSVLRGGVPWDAFVATWTEHFNEDNARLGNMLAPVLLVFPKWVGSGLMSAAWVVAMWFSFRMSGVRMRDLTLTASGVVMWGLMLPWSNGLVSLDYQLNYILPSALAMPLACKVVARRGRDLSLWAAGLLAFAVGACHEGFSVPFIIGLAVVVAIDCRCRRPQLWAAMCGMAAGLALLLSAPGMAVRASGGLHLDFAHIVSSLGRVAAFNVLFIVLVVLAAVRFRRIGLKRAKRERVVWFAIVNSAAAIAMMAVTSAEPRVAWWGIMMSVVGILYILRRGCRFFSVGAGWKQAALLLPFLVLVYVRFGIADSLALRMRTLLTEDVEHWRRSSGAVFGEVLTCADFPLLSYKLPDVLMFNTNTIFIDMYYGSKAPHFAIVPVELRELRGGAGAAVPGDAGLREYSRRLYRPVSGEGGVPRLESLTVDYGFGPERRAVWVVPFVSAVDGRRYEYVYVYTSWFNQRFRTLKNASL